MKVVIIGGAGYIGSHVVLDAVERGYDITVFDDLSTGYKENINENIQFIHGSTLSISDLSTLFTRNRYDAVVHLAASKAAGESMLEPAMYARNNIIGGQNVINACSDYNIKIVIFSSSAAVYGLPQYNLIDECHPLSPTNYYGQTKLHIEESLEWFSKLKGIKYASLRYFNAAGYDLKKRVKSLEINPQNLIPKVMEVAIGRKTQVAVYGNDYNTKDGTGVRDYIHVSDLAKAHIDSINYISKNKENLTINLGNEIGYSVLDVISKSSEVSEKRIEHKIEARREGDIGSLIANTDLAKQLIGWKPRYSDLDTIINSTWEIYKI
tara:strand:- start:620 stop:1588 length:969 start_codon:yes stop_codon:yes gene_type:complete